VLKRSRSRSPNYGTVFDYDNKLAEIAAIEQKMAAPGFWDNQDAAQEFVAARQRLGAVVKPLGEAIAAYDDLEAMIEMAAEDDGFAAEVPAELDKLEGKLEQLQMASLLGGPHDQLGALLSINAGEGGTDANDWAEMLQRMYMAWAQANDYEVSLVDRNENDEAGINSATISIRGPFAYGYLKGETGVHRLVRISPFNSEGKRQTSFAAVDVSPEVAESEDVEINEADVRTDTYRASGAGGQHVNKTDSAIRLTHLPTGIVVQCQSERSQHKNRASAWKMLRSRMVRLEDEKREAEEAARYKSQVKVGFGSQIRNYFLHPDQRVKDSRTGHSAGSFHAVLDGDIQGFLDAYLRWRAKTSESMKSD
jgi:peptide chain release factor 2